MTAPAQNKSQLRALFFGGILPIIAFSVIEDRFGTVWGLLAGMIFGSGEILYEWRAHGEVDVITWGANGMILVLGTVSLVTRQGVWFKLQPAIIEALMALLMWGAWALNKPILFNIMKKQMSSDEEFTPELEPIAKAGLQGMAFRMGLFFAIHAVWATWAALYRSTAYWALLKGVGFTGSMIVYGVVESLVLRYRISTKIQQLQGLSKSHGPTDRTYLKPEAVVVESDCG